MYTICILGESGFLGKQADHSLVSIIAVCGQSLWWYNVRDGKRQTDIWDRVAAWSGAKQTNISEEEALIQTEHKWLALLGYHVVDGVAATWMFGSPPPSKRTPPLAYKITDYYTL